DGWRDGLAGGGVGRLLAEQQVVRRPRRDVKGRRGGAGERAVRGGEGVAGARLVQGQVAERGHATDRGYRQGAGQRGAARVRTNGHRDIRGVAGHDVVEGIDHAHGDRRRDGLAGGGVTRLLAEEQVVGRPRRYGEAGRRGPGEG